MRIKYVGNAGVIIETEETCVAIDCFCRDESGIYEDLSASDRDALFEMIESGKLKILIFTHEHSDHFFAGDVKRACEKSCDLKVVAGKKVIDLLYKEGVPAGQLVEVVSSCKIEIGDFRVTFLQTVHDGEQYTEVENLTLLINIGRKTMVITGDALPSKALFSQIAHWSKTVDLLIAPFPYVGLGSARRAMAQQLDAMAIIATHEPRPEQDHMGWIRNTEKVCSQAKDGLPYPVFSKKQKEWYCL